MQKYVLLVKQSVMKLEVFILGGQRIDHEKIVHGLITDECTKNFSCPFDCGVHPFRRNKDLLSHCDKIHQEQLGKFIC